jgi:predicted PurR-regulated permease PerM
VADDDRRADRWRVTNDLGEFLKRVLVVAAVGLLLALAWQWRHVLFLTFASVLIACGLRGLAQPIRKRTPLGEGGALAVACLVVVGVLGGIGFLFGSQISAQLDTVAQTLPGAWRSLELRLARSPGGQFVLDQIRAVQGQGIPQNFLSNVGAFGMAFFSGALEALLVVIAAIFFAVTPGPYRNGSLLLLPKELRPPFAEAMEASGVALRKWLLGTLVSMAAIAVIVWFGLMLVGVPGPLALGLLAGLGQFVPVIGPLLAAVPGILLALAVEPATALWTALIYFVASQFEANLLYPLIQQRAVSQPPVITIYAVVAFGLLFGPLGVLLAVPITVVVTIFVVKFYVQRTLGEDVPLPGQSKKQPAQTS